MCVEPKPHHNRLDFYNQFLYQIIRRFQEVDYQKFSFQKQVYLSFWQQLQLNFLNLVQPREI